MAYSAAFAAPPQVYPSAVVITPGAGLIPPETIVNVETIRSLAEIDIHVNEPRYRAPLESDARLLCEAAGETATSSFWVASRPPSTWSRWLAASATGWSSRRTSSGVEI